MSDEHNLPAQIPGSALAPAEQYGSLVARGLEAIRNRQGILASLSLVEADPDKLFRQGAEADERGDFDEAVKWYRKAAERGHAGAQSNLGLMHAKGQWVPQDYAAAASWFRKCGGPEVLNRISASISGTSTGVMLPRGAAAS